MAHPENRVEYKMKGDRIMFESEYAKTEYIEKDNVVFHVWKKEAHYEDYRDPVIASLEMLREHEGSVFIVDARNGFEDVKEDKPELQEENNPEETSNPDNTIELQEENNPQE